MRFAAHITQLDINQQRGEKKAAADTEHARQKAHAEAHAQNDQPMDRHLGDGQIDFHQSTIARGMSACEAADMANLLAWNRAVNLQSMISWD